jgi:outer membrane protein assembly factor BamA
VLVLAAAARPGAAAVTARRETTGEGGFLASMAERLSWFDWLRAGGGGGGPDSSSSAEVDRETERRNLEPFCGCMIDTIIVSGNTRTKTISLLREMASKQGQCLDRRLIRRDGDYLRGLGYFAKVAITAEDSGEGRCRLLIAVVERPGIFMYVPYPVVNYDFEKGISYGFAWKIKNFRGYSEDLGLSAIKRTEESQGAGLFWNVPWFMGRRVRFRFDAYSARRLKDPNDADEEFIKEQNGANIGFGFPLTRSLVRQVWFQPSLSFEARNARLGFVDRTNGETKYALYRQNFISAGAQIEYDSRDNHLDAFNGMVHRLRVRRFTSTAGPDQQFVFYGFSHYFYVPIGFERSFIIALDGDVREGDLPSFYQMELGGQRDVRGFPNGDLRGTVKLVGTLEYRMRLIEPHILHLPKIGSFDIAVNGIAFIDNGALMDSILDLGTTEIHRTVGLGVEIISPFRDLIRLEVSGNRMNQLAFYMAAGTDF